MSLSVKINLMKDWSLKLAAKFPQKFKLFLAKIISLLILSAFSLAKTK
ncbi:MAG: hypothetical protein MJ252_23575 [archaeon]|nr:hypothetical protein [archaeon]